MAIFLVIDQQFRISPLFSLFPYISPLFRGNYYFSPTFKNPPCFRQIHLLFTCFPCISFPTYFDHDGQFPSSRFRVERFTSPRASPNARTGRPCPQPKNGCHAIQPYSMVFSSVGQIPPGHFPLGHFFPDRFPLDNSPRFRVGRFPPGHFPPLFIFLLDHRQA